MQSDLFSKVVQSMDRVNLGELLYALGVKPHRTAGETVFPIIGAVVVGAAIGAGTALLLSPRTGAQIRELIEQRVGQGFEALRSKMRGPETGTDIGGSRIS